MDIFKFNPTNLDPLTETFDLNFYFSYLARWPHLFNVAEGQNGVIDGYRAFHCLWNSEKAYTLYSDGKTRVIAFLSTA